MNEESNKSAFSIDVDRRTVRVVSVGGDTLNAQAFVDLVGPEGGGGSLTARLNDPQITFLPLEVGGQAELFNVHSVAYVTVDGTLPVVERLQAVGASEAPVDLTLISGKKLLGTMLYEAAEGDRRRLSDDLNAPGTRFIVLMTQGSTTLVRRDAISRVRFRDET